MSDPTPYQTLGVTEDASFEEIQVIKAQLSQKYQEDSAAVEKIEAAYDAIIMERLRLRQEGKIKAPERIRFPEKSVEVHSNGPSFHKTQAPSWLQNLVDTPSKNDILLPAGIFLALVVVSFFSPNGPQSLRPLLLVAGVFVNLYFLNRKEKKFARAFLLTLLGLIAGVALGTGLTALLGSAGLLTGLSAEAMATGVTFLVFWLISSFLR